MINAVMKGLRFADSQEWRFQASERSNMGSDVLVGGRSADIQEFCFKFAYVKLWTVSTCRWFYLLNDRNGIFTF